MRKYITKASERIGVESTSRDGKRAQVVSYSTCENFIIRFCDGKEMKLKNWRYFGDTLLRETSTMKNILNLQEIEKSELARKR